MAPPKTITKPVSEAESERRLRPALNVLYSSDNPRPALKLATQAEAKRPGWPAARAVRAIALRRLGRIAEADAVAASVLSDLQTGAAPADEDAAAKLYLYYRESPRREAETAAAYEAVARACEEEPFLAESSFYWKLRARDWAGAQRIVTRLQRTSGNRPKEEYAVWTAAAVWLGNGGGGIMDGVGASNPKMGALAAAMVRRAVCSPSSSPPSADVARFGTRLLCDVGAHADAAAIMARGGIAMGVSEAGHICADISFQSGNVGMAKELYQSLLVGSDADDWGHWLRFINLHDTNDSKEPSWAPVEKIVANLCEKARDTSRPARGPFLADMEVRRRQKDWEGLRGAILYYFGQFGDKPVCSHDLRPYVLSYCGEGNGSCARLVEGLEEASATETDASARHLHLAWLKLWLNCLDESADDLRKRHEALLLENLESTERQPGDDYIILAAHKLLPADDGEARYSDYGRVLQAITLVETALMRSPHNFHFKLLVIRLYVSVGAMDLAFKTWCSLEIKHVQIATLSHLVTGPMFELGAHEQFAAKLRGEFDKLWLECTRDVPESVARAFGEGMVNAAVEFLEFRDRIERSTALARGMLYDALVQLNLSHGDTLGLERAWSKLGNEARFLPQSIAMDRPLMANEDEQCMEFWDTQLYDPQQSQKDMDAPGADGAKPMSADDQRLLLIRLVATRCIVQEALRGMKAADMEDDIELLRTTQSSLSDSTRAKNPWARYLCSLALHEEESAASVSSYIVDEAAALEGAAIDGCLAPSTFARAGRLVYEMLLLASLALAKLPPKGSLEARAARAEHKSAAVEACATLVPLVAPIVARGDDAARFAAWEAAWAGDDARPDVTAALASAVNSLHGSLSKLQTRFIMMA